MSNEDLLKADEACAKAFAYVRQCVDQLANAKERYRQNPCNANLISVELANAALDRASMAHDKAWDVFSDLLDQKGDQ